MTIPTQKLSYLSYLYDDKLSYFQYKSYWFLPYLYYLYDRYLHTFNTSHTLFGCPMRCLRVGLSWVLRAQICALAFQIGNCQRAIYVRDIAARQLKTHFP